MKYTINKSFTTLENPHKTHILKEAEKLEKWYALLQCGIVYEILHCTENQIREKISRYNQQTTKFFWSYEEV